MGKKDKLIKRLKSRSKDFTFDEAETLLKYFDFAYSNKGKTSGSRVIFESENHGCIMLHKPHPQKELKDYQIKQLIEYLEQEDLPRPPLRPLPAPPEVLSFQRRM